MARAPPRRSTFGTYPLILAPCSSVKCGSRTCGGTCISSHAGPTTTSPVVPTLATIEGSPVNFAAFFPQHDATFAPKTRRERRAASDETPCSSNPTRSQPPSPRHARIESLPRLEANRQRHSLFRCAQHQPTLFAGDFTASTHWHDLSVCRDARRDVARCRWRRPPHHQHT